MNPENNTNNLLRIKELENKVQELEIRDIANRRKIQQLENTSHGECTRTIQGLQQTVESQKI